MPAARFPEGSLVSVFIPGLATPKARPRAAVVAGQARVYTPKKTAAYEAVVRYYAAAAMVGREPIEGPITVVYVFRLPIPASWSKRKTEDAATGRVVPACKPDLTNLVKSIEDAANGILWRDDSQITTHKASKRYGSSIGVLVEVFRDGQ